MPDHTSVRAALSCFLIAALLVVFTAAGMCVADETAGVYGEISASVLTGDYAGAEGIAGRFMDRHPDHPAGPLFRAAVIQYAATDYGDYSRENDFFRLTGESIGLARASSDVDRESALWNRYYEAAAQGLEGAWKVSAGDFLRGVLTGRSGARGMDAVVKADSTFYDAYLLLGSYRFWKNVALSRLPLIDLGRRRGIAEVRLAIERGTLNGPLANTVLLEMLLEYDPPEAVRLGELLHAAHPSCRLFLWQLGEAHKKLDDWSSAERIFTLLAGMMAADEHDDGSGELRCRWKLAVLADDLGRAEDRRSYAEMVIAFSDDPVVAERQERRIRAAHEMLEER